MRLTSQSVGLTLEARSDRGRKLRCPENGGTNGRGPASSEGHASAS